MIIAMTLFRFGGKNIKAPEKIGGKLTCADMTAVLMVRLKAVAIPAAVTRKAVVKVIRSAVSYANRAMNQVMNDDRTVPNSDTSQAAKGI